MNTRPWHEQHPHEYERVRKSIEKEFPYLNFTSRGGASVVTGTLPIVEGGRVIADFETEIVIPADGPRADIPVVREIGGHIPHGAHRHNARGEACLCVPDEFWYRHPGGMDLVDFLRGPVTSYFLSQVFYDLHGKWPFNQRSHEGPGVLEFYAEILGISDPEAIDRFLGIISSPEIKLHWWCPCRRKRRISDCHLQTVISLRERIPRTVACDSRRKILRTKS